MAKTLPQVADSTALPGDGPFDAHSARSDHQGRVRLLAVVVLGGGELGQDVRGVGIAARGETSQLIKISALACELDEDVGGVRIAAGREAAKLVQITAFAGELHQLGDGVPISGCRLCAQLEKVLIGHGISLRDTGFLRYGPPLGSGASLAGWSSWKARIWSMSALSR